VGDLDHWQRADATDTDTGPRAGRSAFDFYGAPEQSAGVSAEQPAATTRT
jgi:hypothetical protein